MTTGMSLSRLANIGAASIEDSFASFRVEFREITRRSASHFAARDWHGMHDDASDRLGTYRHAVERAEAEIRSLLGSRLADQVVWAAMKSVFSGRIAMRDDWELAETFFNSVTRRVFATVGVDPDVEFVDSDFEVPPTDSEEPPYFVVERDGDSLAGFIRSIVEAFEWEAPFADLAADSKRVADRLAITGVSSLRRAEMVRHVFYRGMGAYLIGRLGGDGPSIPFVLALRHPDDGIAIDAVLLEENDVSVLFSYTRAYFHVEAHRPSDLVSFISSLLPRKRVAEIYIALGFNKHGKTELYRDLLHFLGETAERFERTRGTPGMVMAAFGMPSDDLVFKVIRDSFPPPKTTTPAAVREKYRLVFQRDRAGRLVDAQEFEHLQFDRARFDDDLLAELLESAGRTIEERDGRVVVHHAYVERRVTPLDLYVREEPPQQAEEAVIDWGRSIKDLAASDIFPGDMLMKNFGVTRMKRVVFYDYDELTLLREVNVRDLPTTDDPFDEMSDQPWFGVGPDDIFPEEFRRFLGLPRHLREVFEEHHDDLFDPAAWRATQARIAAGELIEILPYRSEVRLLR